MACEYHAQSAVDAAVELRDELGGDVKLIESIHLGHIQGVIRDYRQGPGEVGAEDAGDCRPLADVHRGGCTAGWDGDEAFVLAADARQRGHQVAAGARLRWKKDDALTEGYPEGIPNRITIKTKDGGTLSREVSFPRGHAMNKMSDAEVEQKFLLNVEDVWTEGQARRVIDLVWHIDEQPSLSELMTAMRI